MDRHKEDILKFLFTTDVPFDNNLAERALRMFKVKNKISGCFRNSMSGEFFCRLRSFLIHARNRSFQYFNLFSMYLTLVRFSLQGKDLIPL
jgi:hypothetical protein